MKNILLCTDGSDNARNAIRYALRFFSHEPRHLILLSTYIINNTATGNIITVNDQLKQQTKQLLDEEMNWCTALPEFNGFSLTPMHSFGKTANVVSRILQEKEIKFMIAGSKGENIKNKGLLGSTTCELIEKIPCLKMIVPNQTSYQPPSKKLILTDPQKLHQPHWWSSVTQWADSKKMEFHLVVLPDVKNHGIKSTIKIPTNIENDISGLTHLKENKSSNLSKSLNDLIKSKAPDLIGINVSEHLQKSEVLRSSIATSFPFIVHP